MKTLTGSYLKIFPYKNGEKERLIWWPREVVALRRKEIGFLGYQNCIVLGLSFSVSFQRKTINSISAVASALSSENEMLGESGEIESEEIKNTVHVRFKLQKECAFGQQFLIVGDDPILGLWDPSNGVPFIWSDGHVWTVELDVPCGKVIQYKLILKADTETISWQPGPDRILETWDTVKTITVFEDWDNPESQSIIEEGLITGASEETLMNSELLITGASEETSMDSELLITGASEETLMNSELLLVAENVTEPMQDEGSEAHKLLASANGHASLAEGNIKDKRTQDLITIVNCTKHEEGVLGNDNREINGSDLFSSKDEESLVSEQEVPVLVPGLIPMLTEETEEQMLTEEAGEPVLYEVEKRNVSNSSIGSDEAEELNVKESKDDCVSATLHPTETSATLHPIETSAMLIEVKQDLYRKEQQEIWEVDMNWGRRTFKKFLASLGF